MPSGHILYRHRDTISLFSLFSTDKLRKNLTVPLTDTSVRFQAMISCVTVSTCHCASSHSQCMTSPQSLWDLPSAPTKFNVFGRLKCLIVAAGSFHFCATEKLHGIRKSYCEKAKEQRLKTCKSSSVMASKLWHPSLSNSHQVKSCWKGGSREGMGSRFGFFCGSVTFDWPNNATGGP